MADTYSSDGLPARLEGAGFVASTKGGNWYRKGRVLALRDEAGRVDHVLAHDDVLRTVGAERRQLTSGLVQYTWTDDAHDPADVVDRIRSASRALWPGYAPRVSPDHLFGSSLDTITGQPFDAGGPAGFPKPPGPDRPDELVPRSARDTAGEGVVVGIVDTGMAPAHATGVSAQEWLEGAYLATPGDADEVRVKGRIGNQAGHGTFIAGIVLQHAPGATIRMAKALNAQGFADGSAVADAIERLGRSGVHVLSLSLGCFTRNDTSSMAVETALRNLDRDVVVVACAGNLQTPDAAKPIDDGHGHVEAPVTQPRKFWPAALDWVFSVGALKADAALPTLADFSNSGPWVDAYTKGEDVFSTFLTLDDDRDPHEPKRFEGYGYWSGTSFAAPAVAGAIAARMHRLRIGAHDAAYSLRESKPTTLPGLHGETLGAVLDLTPVVGSRRRRAAAYIGGR